MRSLLNEKCGASSRTLTLSLTRTEPNSGQEIKQTEWQSNDYHTYMTYIVDLDVNQI